MIAATQSLLADLGTGITVDAVASRAGVGKATIHRRWSTSSGLIADAVQAVDPLPHDPDLSGSARARLTSLLQRLTEPLTPAELTVAAALAQAPREPELHRVMEQVLLAPLQERVRAACRCGPLLDRAQLVRNTVTDGTATGRPVTSLLLLDPVDVASTTPALPGATDLAPGVHLLPADSTTTSVVVLDAETGETVTEAQLMEPGYVDRYDYGTGAG